MCSHTLIRPSTGVLAGGTTKKAALLADDYRVRIPNFEGPLDLLLHLIRKDQLNIYDIPIAVIYRKSYLQAYRDDATT